jgi:hypothetical protein
MKLNEQFDIIGESFSIDFEKLPKKGMIEGGSGTSPSGEEGHWTDFFGVEDSFLKKLEKKKWVIEIIYPKDYKWHKQNRFNEKFQKAARVWHQKGGRFYSSGKTPGNVAIEASRFFRKNGYLPIPDDAVVQEDKMNLQETFDTVLFEGKYEDWLKGKISYAEFKKTLPMSSAAKKKMDQMHAQALKMNDKIDNKKSRDEDRAKRKAERDKMPKPYTDAQFKRMMKDMRSDIVGDASADAEHSGEEFDADIYMDQVAPDIAASLLYDPQMVAYLVKKKIPKNRWQGYLADEIAS